MTKVNYKKAMQTSSFLRLFPESIISLKILICFGNEPDQDIGAKFVKYQVIPSLHQAKGNRKVVCGMGLLFAHPCQLNAIGPAYPYQFRFRHGMRQSRQ